MDLNALAQTLDCGQCFRWSRQPDGSFCGVAYGRFIRITEQNLSCVLSDDFWGNYFDMGLDYAKIRVNLSALDPVLAEAARFAPEIHILNQEPWEALCSFILSQCNNIKRICGIVERLSTQYGGKISGGRYAFPTAKALACAREEDLYRLGCGFRSRYIREAARKLAEGGIDFEKIRWLPLEEARSLLMELSGVGPKVADCTLLYGLHRLDAFPADVWVKRAMKTLFPGKTPLDFGPYAGIAQQYVFHYSRNHPELFRKVV